MIYSIDIKKIALNILCYLVVVRSDAKNEILENGVLEQCIRHIDLYPEDDVDEEILALSLELIS